MMIFYNIIIHCYYYFCYYCYDLLRLLINIHVTSFVWSIPCVFYNFFYLCLNKVVIWKLTASRKSYSINFFNLFVAPIMVFLIEKTIKNSNKQPYNIIIIYLLCSFARFTWIQILDYLHSLYTIIIVLIKCGNILIFLRNFNIIITFYSRVKN